MNDSVDPIAYDYHEEAYSFRVVDNGAPEAEGLVLLDASWKWIPGHAPIDKDERLDIETAPPAVAAPRLLG